MLRDRSRYDEILEGFSQSISPYIDYEMHQEGRWSSIIRLRTYIVDMPDRRASLLVRLILQNNGRLSQTKRATFSELKDEEISAIEEAVAALSQDGPSS